MTLPLTMRAPSIFEKSFYFGEERIGPTCCHGIAYSYCIMKQVLEPLNCKKLKMTQVKLGSKNLPSFQCLEHFRPVSKSGALPLFGKVGKSPTILMI
jgi:hypothetical protein